MGQRRMFSNRISNSAKFLQMPEGSQLLYFHMIIRADDDGIVEAYPIIKLLGTAPDNLKVLLAKGFIKQLNEDQVVVITDWHEHNLIRADRKVDSIYINLLKNYPEIPYLEPKPRSDVKDNSKRLNGQSTDSTREVMLSEVNLSHVNVIQENIPIEVIDLTNYFYNKMDKPTRYKNKPPDITKWYDAIDKLNRIDGIDYDMIKDVMDYALTDKFWKVNILSTDKFREKFNTLESHSKNGKSKPTIPDNLKRFEEMEKTL